MQMQKQESFLFFKLRNIPTCIRPERWAAPPGAKPKTTCMRM